MENFYSDVMSLKYCKKCEDDIERMRLGYNPQYGDCKHWECKALDIFNFSIITILSLILFIPLLIFLLGIIIYEVVVGNNYAVQKQNNEKELYDRLERTKFRKSGVDSHTMARSKSRSKK